MNLVRIRNGYKLKTFIRRDLHSVFVPRVFSLGVRRSNTGVIMLRCKRIFQTGINLGCTNQPSLKFREGNHMIMRRTQQLFLCLGVDVRLANIFEEEAKLRESDRPTGIGVDKLKQGVASTTSGDVSIPALLLKFSNERGDFAFVYEA